MHVKSQATQMCFQHSFRFRLAADKSSNLCITERLLGESISRWIPLTKAKNVESVSMS